MRHLLSSDILVGKGNAGRPTFTHVELDYPPCLAHTHLVDCPISDSLSLETPPHKSFSDSSRDAHAQRFERIPVMLSPLFHCWTLPFYVLCEFLFCFTPTLF